MPMGEYSHDDWKLWVAMAPWRQEDAGDGRGGDVDQKRKWKLNLKEVVKFEITIFSAVSIFF